MDFNDTPQEAEYRARVRDFLSQHADPYPPGHSAPGFQPVCVSLMPTE